MKIDTANLKEFREEFKKAVEKLAKKYKVEISLGNISYDNLEFHGKMSVKNLEQGGKKIDADKENFSKYAVLYGLKPALFGYSITAQGKNFKIVGINPRKRKFPIVLEDTKTGKRVCATQEIVVKSIKDSKSK